MKKIFLLVALVFSVMLTAQEKITEGVMISKQTMSTDNEQMKAALAMMGDMKTTTHFKGNKSRSELSNPMSGDVTTIIDGDAQKMLMLMDNPMMGKKYTIVDTKVSEEDLKKIDIVSGKKTKTVLGYECKQYTVTVEKDGVAMEMEMFTTEAIPISSQQTSMLGEKLKGFPLYMVIKMNQMGADMTITTEVTEIKKEKVSGDKFDITVPEGYEKM